MTDDGCPASLFTLDCKNMLYFMRRDQQQKPLLALRAWVFWSAILPWAIPGLVLLIAMGFAVSMGISPLETATG